MCRSAGPGIGKLFLISKTEKIWCICETPGHRGSGRAAPWPVWCCLWRAGRWLVRRSILWLEMVLRRFRAMAPAATLASLNTPKGLAATSNGSFYIADESNSRVRMVNSQGIISTVAGNGTFGYSGDSGLAVNAEFSDVLSVVVDSAGNLYIADPSNRRIRKVNTSGIVATIAGVGIEGYTGDNGPAINAEIGRPTALVLDSAGNLYFADSSSQRIRVISAAGIITTIAGNGIAAYSGDGGAALSASLSYPLGIARDAAGNVYVADTRQQCGSKDYTRGHDLDDSGHRTRWIFRRRRTCRQC